MVTPAAVPARQPTTRRKGPAKSREPLVVRLAKEEASRLLAGVVGAKVGAWVELSVLQNSAVVTAEWTGRRWNMAVDETS